MFIRSVKIDWEKIKEGSYLRDIPALSGLEEVTFGSGVTFFVGENGSGKTTLLEGIAVAAGFNPEGGTKNYAFSTYETGAQLHEAMRLVRGTEREKWGYFFRAESFFNVATAEEEYAKDSRSGSLELHKRSHGESFLSLMHDQFSRRGLYILDEPEAALSPQRQLSLLVEISKSVGKGSQFIIATHSPILLGLPGAEILSFGEDGVRSCAYEETESFRVTEMFINDRDRLLKQLL